MSVPAISKSEVNVTFGYRDHQPLLNRGDVTVTGNPKVVQGPFGNAISFTEFDMMLYRFDMTEPFPCPFNILRCQEGFTLNLWIQLKNATLDRHRSYLKLGNSIFIKKFVVPYVVRLNMFAAHSKWYNEVHVAEEWVHIAVIWKLTESLSYMNGQKMYQYLPIDTARSEILSNELWFSSDSNPGKFSIGNVELWSGMKSPVFIWRLYQDGLVEGWSV